MSNKGSLMFVLHAHLPFVNHPGNVNFLEESWFFEAVVETYVPLISMIERLSKEGINPAITISISSTLAAMLENKALEKKLNHYISERMDLIDKELRNVKDKTILKTLGVYKELYNLASNTMLKHNGNLIEAFNKFQQAGLIEIITTSSTHAILPLLIRPEAIKAQVAVAADDYERRFNKKANGFWLPECGYDRRMQTYLKLSDFNYSFAESHAFRGADSGVYAPVSTGNGVKFFGRDLNSSKEIWSSQFGYPGDNNYREFYRDLGYDADLEYIKPYLGMGQGRKPLGLKYHRITGRGTALSDKAVYDPDIALETVKKHAKDFLDRRMVQMDEIYSNKGIKPVIVGCYDAELFGHWWFEGPKFLEEIIRNIRNEHLPLQIVTPVKYLESSREPSKFEPAMSSWGEKGYFDPWLNESNDDVYHDLVGITDKMISAATRFKNNNLDRVDNRALNQAAREVLLSQASDWTFLMYVNSHREYAFSRIREHIKNASSLLSQVIEKNVDEKFLSEIEHKNSIFYHIDFRVFSSISKF